MLNTRLLAGVAALALAASATAAIAVPKSFHPRHANAGELAAAQAGQGSLDHAITAVEQITGGHVLAIHFDGGAGIYDATISRDGTVGHARVNVATRQVAVLDGAGGAARTFDYKEKAESELVIRGSKIALGEAIASAEQHGRGVAISAETTRSGDGYMVAHDVEIVRAGMVKPILVDAKTGLVIADNQAFGGEP